MTKAQPILSNNLGLPIVSTNHESVVEQIEVFPSLKLSLDLKDPAVLKLLEQGGFILLLLVLCLFFRVLTQFVEAVKKE